MSENASTIQWSGKSGKKYTYFIYPISRDLLPVGTTLKNEGGNYIFAFKKDATTWQAVYYGQTKSLAERFAGHHKAQCILRHGATHILAHLSSLEADRLAEETDLLERGKPICND